MSLMGLVSRVTPVHTAVRNCTRDEGRSFEVGNQVLISSHRSGLDDVKTGGLPLLRDQLGGCTETAQAASGMEAVAQAMPQNPGGTAISVRHAYAVAASGLISTA